MIKIFADKSQKKIENFWNNIHFHPTDAIEDEWGQRILDRVAEDGVARMVRMYTMFEDIVSMGEDGKLKYDFTLNDVRLDYMISKGFDLLISFVAVALFVGLVAFDTQKLKSYYYMSANDHQLQRKIGIIGALSLYLDFINIFLYLLRIFGNRRD